MGLEDNERVGECKDLVESQSLFNYTAAAECHHWWYHSVGATIPLPWFDEYGDGDDFSVCGLSLGSGVYIAYSRVAPNCLKMGMEANIAYSRVDFDGLD